MERADAAVSIRMAHKDMDKAPNKAAQELEADTEENRTASGIVVLAHVYHKQAHMSQPMGRRGKDR